ncbi:hypothetical protein QYM36_015697 [Artemia franciscana]|uniref:Uncharacterized protein n=1 Tax=Artemia franciscana TaxID=6661 RepID=A0AA88KXL2_ARTSF|nr:hypothetical protein QYM36_015697 [Artemia franciscana]
MTVYVLNKKFIASICVWLVFGPSYYLSCSCLNAQDIEKATSGSEAGYTPPETTSEDLPISDNDLAKAPSAIREIASYLGRYTRKEISEEFYSSVDDSMDRRPTEAID